MIISSRILSKYLKNNARNKTQESWGSGRRRRENNKLFMIISSRIFSKSLKNNARNKTQESRRGVRAGRKKEKITIFS